MRRWSRLGRDGRAGAAVGCAAADQGHVTTATKDHISHSPARSRAAIISTIIAVLAVAAVGTAQSNGAVKVFVLAGQSNMEGKVQNPLFEHQATDAKTAHLFAHLRANDDWVVRDDVFIKFLNRHGGLTLGYGTSGQTGCELEFGTMMGDHFDEPVLLIKAAWGGHSLIKLFRSPLAGMPSASELQAELAHARTKKQNEKNHKDAPLPTMADITANYGKSYRAMIAEVESTFADYDQLFPTLKGKELQLAGFVWFQGWNDQFGGAELEYESNLKHFIADVRNDLNAPDLPFVIGVMGQNGSKPAKGAMLAIQTAQMAMNRVPSFAGNVEAVRTDVLVDKAAEKLYPTWRDHLEEWQLAGSDRDNHYLGSAIWYTRIGHAFGDAMLRLIDAN